MAPFPPLDYWMPLPARGSRPAVLSRRWTPAASTASPPPRDYWIPAQPGDSAVSVLERHCACAGTSPARTAPVRAGSHGEETVTQPRKAPAPMADRPKLPDLTSTTLPTTVTLTPLGTAPETVTRLCVGCGKPLDGKRPQAKAHGAACRQRAYRRRKKEAAQAQGRRENGRGSKPELAALTGTAVN